MDQSYFPNDRAQNVLIFQPILNIFIIHAEIFVAWQSKELSNEKIRSPTTSDNSLSPKLKLHNSKIRGEYKDSCFKQDKVTFTLNSVVNLLSMN